MVDFIHAEFPHNVGTLLFHLDKLKLDHYLKDAQSRVQQRSLSFLNSWRKEKKSLMQEIKQRNMRVQYNVTAALSWGMV